VVAGQVPLAPRTRADTVSSQSGASVDLGPTLLAPSVAAAAASHLSFEVDDRRRAGTEDPQADAGLMQLAADAVRLAGAHVRCCSLLEAASRPSAGRTWQAVAAAGREVLAEYGLLVAQLEGISRGGLEMASGEGEREMEVVPEVMSLGLD